MRDLWDKKNYDLKESDVNVSFVNPVLYDLYEKQKLTEAKFAIYKAYTDNDEMSKSLAMKNVLGWSDEKIKENFMSLIKDKQMVAVADYYADKISDENAPVDFKSPIKLKSDVDKEEKVFTGDAGSSDEGGSSDGDEESSGGDEEASSDEEESAEDEGKPAETPTFGLGE